MVLFIQVRPGDRIELVRVEPLGVAAGATVEFFYAPQIPTPGGGSSIGDRLLPIEGAAAEAPSASPGPMNTFGIVARLTAQAPGRYVLSSVRLHYRLNTGPEETREGIDVVLTVCASNPPPSDCPVLETTTP